MNLAVMDAIKDLLESAIAFLPQLGVGFLMLLGLILATAAMTRTRRRRPAAPKGPEADADALARGLDGPE